jgi:ferric-dicitrate binding protein FerR (iron transport regulator)
MSSEPRHPAPPQDLLEALSELPEHERAGLEQVWHLLGDAAPPHSNEVDDRWTELRRRLDGESGVRSPLATDRPPVRLVRRPRWPAIAYVTASVFAIALAVTWFAVPGRVTAARGETRTVSLRDGSTVVLNSGASIRYSRRFADRTVELSGEAFFDVAPAGHTFTVSTHNARIEVLGTAFNVRAHAADAETAVALIHGRLRVSAVSGAGPGSSAQLDAGQAVVVQAASLSTPAQADVERAAGWRAGSLSFDDWPLREVLDEIERRYDIEIEESANTPLAARVSAFYVARPTIQTLLGDLGAATGVRFAPTSRGYAVRPAPEAQPSPRGTI